MHAHFADPRTLLTRVHAFLQYRWSKFREYSDMIEKQGGMEAFTRAYDTFGLNRGEKDGKPGVWYREWAPGARAMGLVGEFNSWEPKEGHWATKGDFGHWALFLPDSADGVPVIPHECVPPALFNICLISV